MAETRTLSAMSRTKSDVVAMKDTLCAQQLLLQKLYAELDQEREASATAASEALDMILRLQGEKAVVEMEASHYKRMAEEKIGHAEASIEAFEELMYQKEMETASLELQVQAYKHKLMSFGCDVSASDLEFSEDMLINGSDLKYGENCGQSSNVRRINSMPPIWFKSSLRALRKRERSPSPIIDVIPEVVEESTDQEVAALSLDLKRKSVDFASGSGTLDSYLNQIKVLDDQVRVISDCTEGEKGVNLRGRRGRSCSIFSEGVAGDSPCSPNVHDVFEVPQTSEKLEVSKHWETRLEKWNSEAENRLTKPDFVSEGIVESPVKHKARKKKGMLRVHRDIKTPCPKDTMTTIIGQRKQEVCVDCNSQAEFQKLNQRIERLDRERNSAKQEITHEGDGEEQLRLLKDIQSQLKSIQLEMRGWKTKKATPKDDVSLDSLQEAMLHFWL